MNMLSAGAKQLAGAVVKGAERLHSEIVLCPPSPLLGEVRTCLEHSKVALGAQDCHFQNEGAFTGDTSPALLKDIGCTYTIVGHSERRAYHQEDDTLIAKKAAAAHAVGLSTILCIGETEKERSDGKTLHVIASQLEKAIPASTTVKNCVLAYEPVWAIGTGKVAGIADIAEVHAFIAAKLPRLSGIRILYGGSVKAANAKEILATPHVNGVLVGGASLKAEEFLGIAEAAE